ncbi:MAG TPA: GTP-binding protein [Eggerthellaceae bacterium]|nr:GTP-binding protein [Eggerthellaceae bacterium]
MQYITRELEGKFLEASEAFRAVMVTGARQVGKSTMLKHLAQGQGRTVVTMDRTADRELARRDPALFFQTYRPPILIDEIQKAPELLEPLKIMCDESEERGRFWLTGSQSKMLRRTAGDTLAGRLVTLNLYSLSQREIARVPGIGTPSFSYADLLERQKSFPANNVVDTFERIWRGGMPEVQDLSESMLATYFDSYVETYLMRDAVDDNGIHDTEGFRRFLRACAALTGELLNYSNLARAADVSVATAKEWTGILAGMGVIYLLEPFSNNALKRLVKTPKLYFCDTGLAAHLSMWPSANVLMAGAASGHFYETHVVMELVRSYAYGGRKANLTFYRDRDGREIDLVVERGRALHPLEVKKSASPTPADAGRFKLLDASGLDRGPGGIVCMCERPYPLTETDSLIPSNIL